MDVHGSNVHYAKPRSEQKGEAPLEPNHTEFIFVDDGTQRKYGREISFRAKLEQAISGGFFSSKPSNTTSGQHASLGPAASMRGETSGLNVYFSFRLLFIHSPICSDPVPVVLLVVEGGPNTVRTGKS